MTLFMVTHDRYFLERVCNEILELDEGTLYSYKGNYTYFFGKKNSSALIRNKPLKKKQRTYMYVS